MTNLDEGKSGRHAKHNGPHGLRPVVVSDDDSLDCEPEQ